MVGGLLCRWGGPGMSDDTVNRGGSATPAETPAVRASTPARVGGGQLGEGASPPTPSERPTSRPAFAKGDLRGSVASLLRQIRNLGRGATGRVSDADLELLEGIALQARHLAALADGIADASSLAREGAAPSEVGYGRGQSTSSHRPRLLVTDDDPDAREALDMILSEDYEVVLAGDGQEAVSAALAARPDVVVMDLYMPRMDGLAALEALRAAPQTEDVPVIFISGRGDDLTRSRGLDRGAVDFLQKPFSARELKARIERTLRLTRRESQLQELARTDPLTGLANLRAFRARLEEEVKRARRYRTPLACVMVDMDNLKPINDQFGHQAGDAAIGAVAEVIRSELRETDFGARCGGDEFVVLLPHTTAGDARVFAERVRVRLQSTTLEEGGRRLPLGASFGVAALIDEPPGEPGEIMVRRADEALYSAKRAGRGRVAVHPTTEEAAARSA